MRRSFLFACAAALAFGGAAPALAGEVLYCVGDNGAILTFDGGAWQVVPTGGGSGIPTGNYKGIWGSGAGDIYVAYGSENLIRYDGAAWSTFIVDNIFHTKIIDVHGNAENDVVALGYLEGSGSSAGMSMSPPQVIACLYHYDGSSWSELTDFVFYPNADVLMDQGGIAYVSGSDWDFDWNFIPGVKTYSGGALGSFSLLPECYSYYARGLCRAGSLVHCVINGSLYDPMSGCSPVASNIFFYVPGVGWSKRTSVSRAVQAMWAESMTSVWMACDDGSICHLDGSNNATFYESGTTQPLRAIWGAGDDYVFAVGDNGAIVHWDGSAWTAMASGTTQNLKDIWGTGVVTGIDDGVPPAPLSLTAYPNPFNPAATIFFELPEAAHTTVRVHDATGALVRTLVDEYLGAGPRTITWDGKNSRGKEMPSGVYLLSVRAAEAKASLKLVLMR